MVNVRRGLAALLFVLPALLAAACGTQGQDALSPPGVRVYRGPQVRVTHGPTEELSGGGSWAETATPGPPVVLQPSAVPLMSDEEFEQYLAGNIYALLNKIEGKLDRTDINP
jgi:hypothetical protein